jgi:glycolate oxidase FAD binding subunit
MTALVPAMPRSEDELIALVGESAAARRGLVTEGSGTKRHCGPAPADGCSFVCMRGLDRVVSYEPGDMVVTVQAGVRLCDLQRTLREHGQWLPIDPPFADATIGGILATGSSGPRRLAYGTIKDSLLGVRVVGARGEVTKSGGRVVKNVSGYDLHRIHVGAFGSLGVLLEASLKVSARPEVSAALLLAQPSLEAAHALLLGVGAMCLRPSALEAMDARAADALARRVEGVPRASALALVGIEGSAPVVQRHLREFEFIRARAAASALVDGPHVEHVWEALRDAPAARTGDVSVRIGARPHDLPQLLAELEPMVLERTSATVQAALGIARFSFAAPANAGAFSRSLAMWRSTAESRGGYAVAESAPLELAARATLAWTSQRVDPFAAQLRQKWDPDGILNPGRMAIAPNRT